MNHSGAGTIVALRPRIIALMQEVERQSELIQHLQERLELLEAKQ